MSLLAKNKHIIMRDKKTYENNNGKVSRLAK
jgi:hypothetical protein